MDEKTILVIGEWAHNQFAAPLGWLDVHAACTYYTKVRAAVNYLRSPARRADPFGVLLLQSRPGQFSSREVELLHATAPLACLVALVGPWCEGEQRSGRVQPGVVRVPWRAWQYRLAREMGLAASAYGTDRLPRTATDVDRLERDVAARVRRQSIPATAIVHSDRRANYECIASLLAYLGVTTVWSRSGPPSSRADFEICDSWPWGQEFSTKNGATKWINEVRQSVLAPAVLLLHFPRPEDIQLAREAGFAAVVAQPLLAGDLAAAINAVLRPAAPFGY
jgi:hypothetical protein